MSEFCLNIDTGNAAFGPCASDRADELARILRNLADRLARDAVGLSGPLRDANGNTVGRWTLDEFDHAAHGYPEDEDGDEIDPADVLEINCTYGRGSRAVCYVLRDRSGGAWYAVDGSLNINHTPDADALCDGVDVEGLDDDDTMTCRSAIRSAEDMARICLGAI